MSTNPTGIQGAVAVLGQGIIGSRIADVLRRAGVETRVWSRRAADLPTLEAILREVELVQIFLRDDQAVLQAVDVACRVQRSGQVILNHATLSRRATLQVAERCNAAGLEFLDAPFTGSRMAAEQGQLCYYVGGPQPLLARVRGLLQLSSAQILHLGGIGEATVLKLVTNLITAVTVKALSEAVAITQACGIDAENLRRALEANANYSKLIGMKLGAMQSGDYAAHFSVVNMLKDADFAASLAADMGLDCGGLAAAAESLRRANEAGLSDQDFSSIHNLSNLNRS